MEKIIKRDYPFTIIIKDKVGKNSGKPYQAITIAHTSVKNKDATTPEEKYETKYFNFFDEIDLLKASSLAENSYIELKKAREQEKASKPAQEPKATPKETVQDGFVDDDLPF